MNKSKMFDAMTRIDERLIDRSIDRKNNTEENKDGKKLYKNSFFTLRKALPVAVSLVLIAAVSVTAIMIAYFSKPAVDQSANQALKAGFDFEKDKSVNGARISVMTEKSKFSLGEDLPVSIYSLCVSSLDKALSGITAKVLMSYSRIDHDNMIETVKIIDDATADGYIWNGSIEQMKCDEITVPAKAFTKAENQDLNETDGVIVWELEVNKTYSDGSESTERDSAAVYYKIENDEVYLKASDETMELAGTAVCKLQQGLVFMPGVSSDLLHTLYDEYEYTAKWVAPELITLETKSDTAAALTELYEELLKEYSVSDIDCYYDYQRKTYEFMTQNAPQPKSSEVIERIRELQNTRMVIEALLALDCYYDQLDENGVLRMKNDFEEYLKIDYASASKYFDDASQETMFEMYRSGRYGGLIVIE